MGRARPPGAPLVGTWKRLSARPAVAHQEYRRRGHLFQGRFKAQVIEADAYAQGLVEYVHLNPVRPRRKTARLAGAREHGFQDDSAVGQVVRRLDRPSLEDQALRAKLATIKANVSSVQS